MKRDFIFQVAVKDAIKLLSERRVSSKDLAKKIEADFYNQPDCDLIVEQTMRRLEELDLLNDLHAAKSYAQRYATKGNHFIEQLLDSKGFDQQIIDLVIESLEDEYTRARFEAEKKLFTLSDLATNQKVNKLTHFLKSRWFDNSVCEDVAYSLAA